MKGNQAFNFHLQMQGDRTLKWDHTNSVILFYCISWQMCAYHINKEGIEKLPQVGCSFNARGGEEID